MKPRIKRDVWCPTGFTCRSTEPGGFMGKHAVIASGETVEDAYANWLKEKSRRAVLNRVKP